MLLTGFEIFSWFSAIRTLFVSPLQHRACSIWIHVRAHSHLRIMDHISASFLHVVFLIWILVVCILFLVFYHTSFCKKKNSWSINKKQNKYGWKMDNSGHNMEDRANCCASVFDSYFPTQVWMSPYRAGVSSLRHPIVAIRNYTVQDLPVLGSQTWIRPVDPAGNW